MARDPARLALHPRPNLSYWVTAMNRPFSRRKFLQTGALAGGGLWLAGCQSTPSQKLAAPRKLSANEKLNLAIVGTANRARENISAVDQENIVALCDIDD